VKDAIVDRMRERCGGQRPSIDKQDPDIKIHLFINNNRCTLSLDSSGDSLHRRGYRPHGTAAPLKENLAAGLLMLAGYDGSEPLFDPMCGSATFLLEAAMIARHIAPGLLREVPFGFQHWPDFDRDLLSQVFDEAESKILPQAPQPIVGMERDRKAYGLARTAIANAGLSEDIRVSLADAFQQSEGSHMKADHGLVITNPPYGVRLEFEDEARVVAIHKRLGDLFKKQFSGWRGAVITASDAGAKSIGLKPKRRFPVKNGGLDSRFMIYELYQGTKRRHNVEA
jgi:putative N6-adenine-specific DNA methylase